MSAYTRPAEIYPRTTDYLPRGSIVSLTLNRTHPMFGADPAVRMRLLSVDGFGVTVASDDDSPLLFPWNALQSVEVVK